MQGEGWIARYAVWGMVSEIDDKAPSTSDRPHETFGKSDLGSEQHQIDLWTHRLYVCMYL